ncbi:MAG: N-acyl homoserine lactonase family protein [Olsenella sp.]|jgi:N-acyl homoserine lactone hydrolase|nr:N-acyl homoserine lactonase family protein [Olsenella sp.]
MGVDANTSQVPDAASRPTPAARGEKRATTPSPAHPDGSAATPTARVTAIQTGATLVSPAVPDRSARRLPLAYTGLLQRRASRIQVPVKAFLVQVAGHRVLVDAGWGEACATSPLSHLGFSLWFASEPVLAPGEGIGPQLARLGLSPADLDAVVLTHLDCDHASGLADLTAARRVVASPQEIDRASRGGARYRRTLWDGVSLEPARLSPDPSTPFGQSCDLFGDGSLCLVLTPGHTEGSMCVVATNPSDGRFAVLAGDCGYNARSWDDLRLPGPLADAGQMRRSLEWVASMRRQPNCAGVFAAHDPAVPAGTVKF